MAHGWALKYLRILNINKVLLQISGDRKKQFNKCYKKLLNALEKEKVTSHLIQKMNPSWLNKQRLKKQTFKEKTCFNDKITFLKCNRKDTLLRDS